MAKKVQAFLQKPSNRQPPGKRHAHQPGRAHAGIGHTARGSKPELHCRPALHITFKRTCRSSIRWIYTRLRQPLIGWWAQLPGEMGSEADAAKRRNAIKTGTGRQCAPLAITKVTGKAPRSRNSDCRRNWRDKFRADCLQSANTRRVGAFCLMPVQRVSAAAFYWRQTLLYVSRHQFINH